MKFNRRPSAARWLTPFHLLSLAAVAGFGVPEFQSRAQAADAIAATAPPPAGATNTLPASVDLRPAFDRYGLERSRQGSRPTCSVFTVAGAIEFAVARRQGHGTRLSVEFLNWAANKACGDAQDGGFFSDLWKGFEAYGICTARDLPYQPGFNPVQPPPSEALTNARTRLGLGLRLHWIKEWNVHTGLTEAHLRAIKETLDEGWPVCGGFRWPKKEQWVDDVLQMCPSNAVRDGHSVLLVGYRDDAAQPGGGVFIFRNTAGRGRDGYMPYEYAQHYMNDAVWIEEGSGTKSGTNAAAGSPTGSAADTTPLRTQAARETTRALTRATNAGAG